MIYRDTIHITGDERLLVPHIEERIMEQGFITESVVNKDRSISITFELRLTHGDEDAWDLQERVFGLRDEFNGWGISWHPDKSKLIP